MNEQKIFCEVFIGEKWAEYSFAAPDIQEVK